jgi:hypothetical protein
MTLTVGCSLIAVKCFIVSFCMMVESEKLLLLLLNNCFLQLVLGVGSSSYRRGQLVLLCGGQTIAGKLHGTIA